MGLYSWVLGRDRCVFTIVSWSFCHIGLELCSSSDIDLISLAVMGFEKLRLCSSCVHEPHSLRT